MKERLSLMKEKIQNIVRETEMEATYGSYFVKVASFLLDVLCVYENPQYTEDENKKLYQEMFPENYEQSFLNPTYATVKFGVELGKILSFVYAQMYCLIPAAFQKKQEEILIHLEWFVEIYCSLLSTMQENEKAQNITLNCKEIVYWFAYDYLELQVFDRMEERLNKKRDFAYWVIVNSDLNKVEYLYKYGEFIGEDELTLSKYIANLDDEQLHRMADTFTEGYRIGFIKGNKDLSIKTTAQVIYPIGMERVVRLAIENFKQMGLDVTLVANSRSVFHKRANSLQGYYSISPNKQFDFDHAEDEAIFLNKQYVNRKLEVLTECYMQLKEFAAGQAGPAVIETFGDPEFIPTVKNERITYSKYQQELMTTYAKESGKITNQFIKGEERSFTIIAFPTPSIGNDFQSIMKETIELNTLSYEKYENVQQIMIDALDTCEAVCVKGHNGNETNLTINLQTLKDASKQTIFENCVADVNIPVGEIFTSPVLEGTNGILHVKQVFLNGLVYKNLKLKFVNGFIKEYSCSNYEKEEENKKYLKDHLLHHYDSLPMGEFAIGTNTVAYVMGKRYHIEAKLPILIAEKTGPHFAIGDTCYSHAEDVAVYNSDGKEIISRDNEVSMLRKGEEVNKAYYQCHTDITIPYDELDSISGIHNGVETVSVLKDGQFVLKGCEFLNAPFLDL